MLFTYGLLLSMMAVGRALAAVDVAGPRAADALNRLAVMVFFPAVILRNARDLHVEPALLFVPAVAWGLLGLAVAVGALVRRRGVDVGHAAAIALGLGFGNTAFLGYTLVPALLSSAGDDALRFAVVYDQLGSFLGLSSVGLVGVSLASGGKTPSVATMLRRVVLFPPFIALVVAVVARPTWPPVVDTALLWAGRALLPAMAIALGLRVRLHIPGTIRGALALVVGGKLLVAPALALAVALAVDVDATVRAVVVLQAGMPVMVTIGALLTFAGVAVELATAMVAWSTLASLLTLPLWAALLQHL